MDYKQLAKDSIRLLDTPEYIKKLKFRFRRMWKDRRR